MSYALAAVLQKAIFVRLQADTGLIGTAVYDAVPPETAGTYVTLGPEDVEDASDQTGAGAVHEFVVSVISDEAGFARAKAIAAVISDTLSDADLTLERGYLVGLWFLKAQAQRVEKTGQRRIDMTFRARVGV